VLAIELVLHSDKTLDGMSVEELEPSSNDGRSRVRAGYG
jgi:hypothetical protein